jgi:hypothetical protein
MHNINMQLKPSNAKDRKRGHAMAYNDKKFATFIICVDMRGLVQQKSMLFEQMHRQIIVYATCVCVHIVFNPVPDVLLEKSEFVSKAIVFP